LIGFGNSTRIILADDHPVVLMGIRALLEDHGEGLRVVGEAVDARGLHDLLEQERCDLLITDYCMPGAMPGKGEGEDGLMLLHALRRQYPDMRIIVLTMVGNAALIRGMLAVGVDGVVNKTALSRELLLAVRAVLQDRDYLCERTQAALGMSGPAVVEPARLSRREAEVVRLFASGMSVTQIAERLHRSVKTVSKQKNDAIRKLGLAGDAQLYEYARSVGLLP
jgi:two-component system capsular synthesis response regulator RcsB